MAWVDIWQMCCPYLHLNCFNPVPVLVLFSRSLSISVTEMLTWRSPNLTAALRVLRQAVLLVNISSRDIHRKLICLLHTGWQHPSLHGGERNFETPRRQHCLYHSTLPHQRGPYNIAPCWRWFWRGKNEVRVAKQRHSEGVLVWKTWACRETIEQNFFCRLFLRTFSANSCLEAEASMP